MRKDLLKMPGYENNMSRCYENGMSQTVTCPRKDVESYGVDLNPNRNLKLKAANTCNVRRNWLTVLYVRKVPACYLKPLIKPVI